MLQIPFPKPELAPERHFFLATVFSLLYSLGRPDVVEYS